MKTKTFLHFIIITFLHFIIITFLHFIIITFLLLLAACGSKQQQPHTDTIIRPNNIVGSNTRYGLACDGCTDSILVLLPAEGNRLDTFDIIQTHEQRRIYGRPHIGDEIAVILHDDSTQQVSMVVNLSTLQDTWCYMVAPTLRHPLPPTLPDSIRQRIMAEREYSLQLKRDGTARARSGNRERPSSLSQRPSLSTYPLPKRYGSWLLNDGQLILLPDSSRILLNDSTVIQKPDTVTIKSLRRDTLVLQFSDHEQRYYRKPASGNNK